MPLGLFPEEDAQAMDALYRGSPMGPPQPHWYSGVPSGIASGIGEGAMKTLEPLAPTFDSGSGQNILLGAMAPDMAFDDPPKPISPQLREDPREAASNLTKQFAADPATTGWVGQLLHNVTSVGLRFVGGTLVGGPLAGAALAGGTEGYSRYQASIPEMDDHTAKQLAAADGLMTGAGAFLPMGVGGSTTVKMLSGATINLAAGAGSRALTHTILEDAGYPAQAAQYRVMDGQSLAADAVLGLAFGWLGRNHGNVPQAAVDAAHVAEDNAHVETGLFGDIPVDGQARNDHIQNVIDATKAELNGEPVPAMRPVETVPNPAQEAARAAGARGVDSAVNELHDDLTGTPVEPEVVPKERTVPLTEASPEIQSAVRQKQIRDLQATEVERELSDSEQERLDTLAKQESDYRAASKPSGLSRAARIEEAVKAEAEQTARTVADDPELSEAVAQAQEVMARNPGKLFEHPETGEAVDPNTSLQESLQGMRDAESEGKLGEVAAACFGRG